MLSSITIKEISSICGYSVSTVSKALNDKYEINDSTKKKIKKIAKLNNYIPNNAARVLRNRKTKVIAVIVPIITKSYFNNFICEIQKKASAIGYRVMVSQSFGIYENEKECIKLVNDGSVDGILLLTNNRSLDIDIMDSSFQNIIKIPYQVHDEFDMEGLKKLAYSSFQKIISEK